MTHQNAISPDTMHTILSPVTARAIQWLLAILIIDYAAITVAALIDLRSGLSKAHRAGIPHTSGGYRRTIDKLSRYYTTLMALTAIDAMLVISALMLRSTAGWTIPAFPLFTTLGAIAMTFIEAKSVIENTQRKSDFTGAARSITDIIDDPDFKALIKRIQDLTKKPD